MAAMLKQPWPPFLPYLFLTLFSLLFLFPYHSCSLSNSPQNIETFFPNATLPQPNPPPSSSSDRKKITRAVLITAASTLLVAVVLLFFVHKYVISPRRRRRDRVGVENNLPTDPPLAEAALAREGFTRFSGNVKGLILEENGLDVLYWRKSQSQRDNKIGSFRKEIVHGEEDIEKNVIYPKNKKKTETVTEIPLLRGRSSTSHSVIHNEDYLNATNKTTRGSFSFDGDLMEALFGYVAVKKNLPEHGSDKKTSSTSPSQIFILDPRKSQNTSIVFKSLGMTCDELVESFMEGNDFQPYTLEKLARIAPTIEEQSAILQFDGETTKLADAELFMFHLLKAVPCAFTRLNVFLFRANYYPEISKHNNSLQTLDSACRELRSRGLFFKLLQAILKSGNRMNAGTARGDAQAFNLTAVLKLSDVKSVDGKTTLLNFVVEEVVRSEGKRCLLNRRTHRSSSISQVISKEEQEKEYIRLGLPVVRGLSSEFSNVKKAADINYDSVSATSLTLSSRAKDARRVLTQCEGEGEKFVKKMKEFLVSVEKEVKLAREEEKRVMELVKRTTEYYQAGTVKEKNPLHLFVIVKDFLPMVDKVCVEIAKKLQRTMGSPQQRNSIKFPVLPPNFMSDRSKTDSGRSDSDI